MTNFIQYIEDHTLRCEAGYRGGGIEIDLADFFNIHNDDDYTMTAYQNYLGGGMLGKICNSYSFAVCSLSQRRQKQVQAITEALNRYFHNLTNHDDEWETETFEQNQLKSVSAY